MWNIRREYPKLLSEQLQSLVFWHRIKLFIEFGWNHTMPRILPTGQYIFWRVLGVFIGWARFYIMMCGIILTSSASFVSLGFFFLGERHSTTLSKVLRVRFPKLASLESTPSLLGARNHGDLGKKNCNLGYSFVIHVFFWFKNSSLYNTNIIHDSTDANFLRFEENGVT